MSATYTFSLGQWRVLRDVGPTSSARHSTHSTSYSSVAVSVPLPLSHFFGVDLLVGTCWDASTNAESFISFRVAASKLVQFAASKRSCWRYLTL